MIFCANKNASVCYWCVEIYSSTLQHKEYLSQTIREIVAKLKRKTRMVFTVRGESLLYYNYDYYNVPTVLTIFFYIETHSTAADYQNSIIRDIAKGLRDRLARFSSQSSGEDFSSSSQRDRDLVFIPPFLSQYSSNIIPFQL